MSFLGGIVKSVINPVSLAQLAMGPAGWASLAVRTIATAIGKEVIQQVGQKLGLPQSMISMAQQAFSASVGGKPSLSSFLGRQEPASLAQAVRSVASQFNMTPTQEGSVARSANNMVSQLVKTIVDDAKVEAKKLATPKDAQASGSKNTSYLQAMAEALGGVMDKKMDELSSLSDQIAAQSTNTSNFNAGIGSKDTSIKTGAMVQENGAKMGTLNAKLSAASQELSIMQNAVSTALKTIGEAQAGLARKG